MTSLIEELVIKDFAGFFIQHNEIFHDAPRELYRSWRQSMFEQITHRVDDQIYYSLDIHVTTR